MKKAVFLLFLLVLFISTVLYSKLTIPKGDEVHYLIAAESIVKDGDFYLENNYSNDTIAKFGYRELDKHTVKGRGGHEVLGHGLTMFPLIIAPFYLLAGKLGVNLFLGFISFLLFKQAVKFCLQITENSSVSSVMCLSLFLTLPLAQYFLLVFPEILGGLLIIYCLREALFRRKLSYTSAFLIGLAPWIHFRFIMVSVFFVIFWFAKQFKKPAKSLLLSTALILLYYLSGSFLFGSFDIGKWFMNTASTYSGNIILNVVNLLIDRQYGLIPVGPVFLLAIPGMYLWLKKDRQKALTALLLIAAVSLPFINSSDWHGGFAPPGRYLIAVIPVIIPAIVFTVTHVKSFLAKTIWGLGFIWGLAVYLVNLFTAPNHGYLYKDGMTPYLNELSVRTGVYFYRIFPGFFPDEKITIVHFLWIVCILFVSRILVQKRKIFN